MRGTTTDPGQPIDWRKTLAIFIFAGLVESAFYGQLISFTPLFLPQLGVLPDKIGYFTGLIASVTMFIALPSLQSWGMLTDQLTRKSVILRTFLLHILVGLSAVLAGNPWVFLFGRAISLLSISGGGLMLNGLRSKIPPDNYRFSSFVLGLALVAGLFLGPLLGGPLLDRLGFRFLVALNVFLLLAAILALRASIQPDFDLEEKTPLLPMMRQSLKFVLRSARMCMLYLALTFFVSAWMLAFTYLPLAVGDLHRITVTGSLVGMVTGGGGLLAILISGLVIYSGNRLGQWKALFPGLVLLMLFYPLPSAVKDLASMALAWAAIFGFASGCFGVLYKVTIESISPARQKLVLALAVLPVTGGMILGPVIGSFITTHSIQVVYPAAMIIQILGLLAVGLAAILPKLTEETIGE